MLNSTSSAASFAPPATVAKPITELSPRQKQKITSELQRIHALVSRVADKDVHKDKSCDKASVCQVEFKPRRPA